MISTWYSKDLTHFNDVIKYNWEYKSITKPVLKKAKQAIKRPLDSYLARFDIKGKTKKYNKQIDVSSNVQKSNSNNVKIKTRLNSDLSEINDNLKTPKDIQRLSKTLKGSAFSRRISECQSSNFHNLVSQALLNFFR